MQNHLRVPDGLNLQKICTILFILQKIILLEAPMNNSSNRNNTMYLDVLRIAAAFMVVVLHVADTNFYTTDVSSFEWKTFNLYDSLVRSSVPLFFMISGTIFLNPAKNFSLRKIYCKNIFKLLVLYIVWSALYGLYSLAWNPDITCLNLAAEIIKATITGHNILWFLPAMITVYALYPIFRIAVADEKLMRYCLLLFFFGILLYSARSLGTLYPNEWYQKILMKFPIDLLCQYSGYAMLGYFLNHINIKASVQKLLYFAGILSIFLCAGTSQFQALQTQKASTVLYGYFSITTFLEAAALFFFAREHLQRYTLSPTVQKTIAAISKHTLGIYLIHYIIIMTFSKTGILTTRQFFAPLSVPTISVIVFVISFFLTYLLKKIPLIGKWLI